MSKRNFSTLYKAHYFTITFFQIT